MYEYSHPLKFIENLKTKLYEILDIPIKLQWIQTESRLDLLSFLPKLQTINKKKQMDSSIFSKNKA